MTPRYWGCKVQSPHDIWTEYHLGDPLAEGGEGIVYNLKPHPGLLRVAKIYNEKAKTNLSNEALNSLAHLTKESDRLSKADALPFVAWPLEIVFTEHKPVADHLKKLAGITMRRISGHRKLEAYTVHGQGRFDMGTAAAVSVATTIASYLKRMHDHGIIFCDFNPKNILVSRDFTSVQFVDADTFQHSIVPNVFTKRADYPGFASADQLNNKPGPRKPHDDNFVLAIHIFHLLLDGGHPFDTGPAYNPTNDPFAQFTPNDNIKAGLWPYTDVARYHPTGETPAHYKRLHPTLKDMFTRAFEHSDPPTAAEWEQVLPRFSNTVDYTTPAVTIGAKMSGVAATLQPYVPKFSILQRIRNRPARYSAKHILNPPLPWSVLAKRIAILALLMLAAATLRLFRTCFAAFKEWMSAALRRLGRGLLSRNAFEIALCLIALFSLFWLLETRNAQLTARKAAQPAIQRSTFPFDFIDTVNTRLPATPTPTQKPPQQKNKNAERNTPPRAGPNAPTRAPPVQEILPWQLPAATPPKKPPRTQLQDGHAYDKSRRS